MDYYNVYEGCIYKIREENKRGCVAFRENSGVYIKITEIENPNRNSSASSTHDGHPFQYDILDKNLNKVSSCYGCFDYSDLEEEVNPNLFDSNNPSNKSMSNLIEKFKIACTREPQKSFRKAGVTDGDDMLTNDGQKVFLTWLLNTKMAAEFKKEVVDGLLEKQEDKNLEDSEDNEV